MTGPLNEHGHMASQSGPASGQLNVSSPPKGPGFHVRFSDQGKSDNENIVIYFTGHGSGDTKDPWLQTFRPEQPSVAIDLNNLAELDRTQGKFVAAEPFTKRVIGFLKKDWNRTIPM
jgi:hypothetical protein